MPEPTTPEEIELAALGRIRAAVVAHDLAGLGVTLTAERANLRPDGRALKQVGYLLTLLDTAPTAFDREHAKLDAVLNPPPPPKSPPEIPPEAGGGEDPPEGGE